MKVSDSNVNLDEISKQIEERDYFDSTRTNSPLRKAEDAIIIDTTRITKEDAVQQVLIYLEKEGYLI